MRNKLFLIFLISIIISGCTSSQFTNYISTSNDKLMDGDKEFRFISFNIPNLHYIEDYLPFDESNPWRLPDEFEIRDALTAIKQMNGKVTRMYVLSVRKQDESKEIVRHVEAPGVFNEEAFIALDKVLQVANEVGVRVILPFVDNWWWWGGPQDYAAFRNKTRDEFWTDSQLISDFKKTVEFIVNRRNTFTGELYKEDKALFGWETGNELVCPFSWTAEIAAYVKSLDTNHVVIEGTHAQHLTEEALNDPHLDVLSSHHYTPAEVAIKDILINREIAKNKKPYFVGEFGLTTLESIKAIVDTVINNDVSGIMIWSLRFRNRDGGFYMHREKGGYGPYRFPGFSSGDNYNEREVIEFMTTRAYQIDGLSVPPLEIPIAPKLFEIENIYNISWEGSTGAQAYVVERRESDSNNWLILIENITDAELPYRPLFADTSAKLNAEYYYRVKAKNQSGESVYSNIVGPVKVEYLKFIDEYDDRSKLFKWEGIVEPATFKEIYQMKEDHSRLIASSGSSVIYRVSENISSIKVDLFERNGVCGVILLTSDSLNNFSPLAVKIETFPPRRNVYGFLTPVSYSCDEFPDNVKFIKLEFQDEVQLSRTEIKYTK